MKFRSNLIIFRMAVVATLAGIYWTFTPSTVQCSATGKDGLPMVELLSRNIGDGGSSLSFCGRVRHGPSCRKTTGGSTLSYPFLTSVELCIALEVCRFRLRGALAFWLSWLEHTWPVRLEPALGSSDHACIVGAEDLGLYCG